MRWSDLRPRQFVRIWFMDHCQIWDGDTDPAPFNYDGAVDSGSVIEVEVRGQVAAVDGRHVQIEGAWITDVEVCFGTYRIVRGAVLGPPRPLPPATPLPWGETP